MQDILMTREAFVLATPEQRSAISRLIEPDTVKHLHVMRGGFDLPNGYLSFRRDYRDGGSIYGGIAPDGSVST